MDAPTLIKPLTSLRFFAALLVLGFHYFDFFKVGYVGVGFFYVLSGYVLAHNYSERVGTSAGRLDFWYRRFARIYPTHVLTWAFALPLAPSFFVTIPALFLVQSWLPIGGLYGAANAPSWSISDEAFFYALFPVLLGIRWRTIWLWAAALIGLAAGWPNPPPVISHGATVDPGMFLFYIFPPVRLFEFTLGIALTRTSLRLHSEIGALAFTAASVLAVSIVPSPFNWSLAVVPASAVMVLTFAHSKGPITTILSNRWLVLLGDASFALYMIHWPLRQYLTVASPLLTSLLAVGLSVAVHLTFERPMQRWLLRHRLRRTVSTFPASQP